MAGLTESGLQNLRGSSFAGFFGMSRSLNTGDYRGFPRNPDLQMRWFTDTAMLVRQRRVAEGRPDPADDPAAYGSWIADVERPARQYRSRYQTHLDEARDLIAEVRRAKRRRHDGAATANHGSRRRKRRSAPAASPSVPAARTTTASWV